MDPAAVIEAAALAELQPMLAATAQAGGHSEVQRFYQRSVVFLTGASGFLGKHLTEKLLRSCDMLKIYVLLRPKKGVGFEKRIEEMTNDAVFDSLRNQKPNFREKIHAIEGDISELRLCIKDNDWKTITEEVNVIFHLAATTNFIEPLQTATLINVRGTREALHLAKDCKKLKSFVHVSTAYSYATKDLAGCDVEERFYPTPVTPETIISMAESMDSAWLEDITREMYSKGWCNTYTFTKAIAEEQVRSASGDLPVCVMRPAAVLSSYREPAPGWVNKSCLNGAIGLILGGFIGIKPTSLVDVSKLVGFIPCDYVNNAIIVAAKHTAANQLTGGNHTQIYTVCSTHRNPITIGKAFEFFAIAKRTIPSPKSVNYYCFVHCTANIYWYAITSLFLQVIPAYIADFVCLLSGKQRRFVKLLNKASGMLDLLSDLNTNEWNFVDNNLERLYSSLTEQDQAIFNFDVTDINWRHMCINLCVGLRKYIIKDGLKNTEDEIKKQKYIRVLNYVVMILLGYGIWKLMQLFLNMLGYILYKCVF